MTQSVGQSLWRRAPIWRHLVIAASFLTVAAVLYPPWASKGTGVPPSKTPPAVYRPQPAVVQSARAPAAVPGNGAQQIPRPVASLSGPAYGQVVSGAVSFAGHLVPLPAGDWIVISKMPFVGPGGEAVDGAALAKIVKGELVGMVSLNGNDARSPNNSGYPADPACGKSQFNSTQVAENVERGRQDCWTIGYNSVAFAEGDQRRQLIRAAYADLRKRDTKLPRVMVFVSFRQAEKTQFLNTTYFFSPESDGVSPPAPDDVNGTAWSPAQIAGFPDKAAYMTRVTNWANDWWGAVRDGFAGRLAAGPLPAKWADRLP